MKEYLIKGVRWCLEEEDLEDLLQGLPGEQGERRHYAVAPYKDGKVFIKTFFEKGGYGLLRNRIVPRGRREYEIGKRLVAMGVPTPRCFGYGVGDNFSCVIQEWIEGEAFVRVFFSHENRGGLLAALAALLRDLKTKGVCHNDLHLDNVLVSHDNLWLIDLHKTRVKGSMGRHDELTSLAHAITMIYGGLDEDEKRLFFESYGNTAIRDNVEAEIKRLRQQWIRNKKKRAFQKTSKITPDGDSLFVEGMEGRGRGIFIRALKNDRKVKVERYSDHIRKIYRGKGRLKKAWRNHIALLYLEFPVIPQAYYLKLPGFRSEGFIAMEDLGSKGRELDRHLDGFYGGMDAREKRDFIHAFSGFMRRVIERGVVHNDVKACNIFVVNGAEFSFLDVEDIDFGDTDEETLARMLTQLNCTIPKRIPVNDRLRFFSKLTKHLGLERKKVLKKIVEESLKNEIVYEGISGLKKEEW